MVLVEFGRQPPEYNGAISNSHWTTMCTERCDDELESLPLPKGWSKTVRHAVLNVVGLVRVAMLAGREILIQNGDVLEAHVHRLETEVALLREELRVIGTRMARIAPKRRPQYSPVERMAIMELRAMRGWSNAETARRFFVSDDTIRSWLRRADDADSLLQLATPVNRFPDFIRYAVQQIKLFCPSLGKVKIAETLARAGIHNGKSTVGRILNEKPAVAPEPPACNETGKSSRIVSKYPNHTWHADTTAVPISGGFWTNWLPNALWQRWPVCWWQLNIVDHFSRRAMGFAVFKTRPTSQEVTAALDEIIERAQAKPKHLIVDQGREFKCAHFEEKWCADRDILPRFGAVNKHGSIAVVERFHRTCKGILQLITIPEHRSEYEREVSLVIEWYNEHRPHNTLEGKTQNEVYFSRHAASEQPRHEPRERWPRGSPCAKPQADIVDEPGDPIVMEIDCFEGRRHLPIIRVQRAA
jgi:transposase InsO family protein